jgi:hypothetical protein
MARLVVGRPTPSDKRGLTANKGEASCVYGMFDSDQGFGRKPVGNGGITQ